MQSNTSNTAEQNASAALVSNSKSITTYAEMSFNVIVTFVIKADIVRKTDGSQLFYDFNIVVKSTDSYDEIMRCIKEATIRTVKEEHDIDASDIWKISTCADWRVWEAVSGRKRANCIKRSKVSKDGKFYF